MNMQEREAVMRLLEESKEEMIAGMVNPFLDTLTQNHELESFKKNLSKLFDYFLTKVSSGSSLTMKSFGDIVENYRLRHSISVEEFLARFEQVRLTIEEGIDSLPLSGKQKSETIVLLYEFFLDLQKQAYLATAEQKNKELIAKEVQLSQLKNDRMEILEKISASFAHEIRNPLTSIKGFVQLLEKRVESEFNEQKYFNFIYKEMEELEQQVNQILLLSHEKNHEDLYFTSIKLNDLIFEVTDAFNPLFMQSKIAMSFEQNGNVRISGLKDQIKLVLYKLLQNAYDALVLKQSDRKLNITLVKEEEDGVITVSNNGPPVPGSVRHALFEPFVGTKELGKGLGLAVSKQLMKKHEGDIVYTSDEEWTIFKLRFPLDNETSVQKSGCGERL